MPQVVRPAGVRKVRGCEPVGGARVLWVPQGRLDAGGAWGGVHDLPGVPERRRVEEETSFREEGTRRKVHKFQFSFEKIRFPEKTGLGPANTTPAKIHPRRPPSGGGRPGHTAAQRTRGPGFSLVGTNKKDSSLLWSSGVRGARTEAPRAPAPARAQTGLLYSELLGSACGRWAIKNTGDMAIGVRALISHYSVTETFEFTWIGVKFS